MRKPEQKGALSKGLKIKSPHGGVARAMVKIDAEIGQKDPLWWMETCEIFNHDKPYS
jgi:hypothetical protein